MLCLRCYLCPPISPKIIADLAEYMLGAVCRSRLVDPITKLIHIVRYSLAACSVHYQPGTHPPLTPVKPPPAITCSTHQCEIESAWSHLCRKLTRSAWPILCLSRNVFCCRKNEDWKNQNSNLSKTSKSSSVLGYGQKKKNYYDLTSNKKALC